MADGIVTDFGASCSCITRLASKATASAAIAAASVANKQQSHGDHRAGHGRSENLGD